METFIETADAGIVSEGFRRLGLHHAPAASGDYDDAIALIQVLREEYMEAGGGDEYLTTFNRVASDLGMEGTSAAAIAVEAVGIECVGMHREGVYELGQPRPLSPALVNTFAGLRIRDGRARDGPVRVVHLLDTAMSALSKARPAAEGGA